MNDSTRALQLIERIYAAVVEPDAWNDFLADLSEKLDGAAVHLSLRMPDESALVGGVYTYRLDRSYYPVFVKYALEGLPWGQMEPTPFRGRFGLASEVLTDVTVAETGLFHDFMEPQGLAADWPVCHLIGLEDKQPLAGIAIFRREGGSALEEHLGLLDSLVPHLARAYALHCQLRDVRQQRRALTEVIDRLPLGVLLVDAQGRVVLMNRSVENVVELEDGFLLDDGFPRLADPRENRTLQKLIAAAARQQPQRGTSAGQVLSITRPSGKRAFPLMVGPLVASSPDQSTDEAKVALFLADPEGGHIGTSEVLESLYQLTHAEAELVRLIAEGRSLDEVASIRGVTIHTVRSQLKQVFAKTDTNRQGELVHLVLTGVAALRDHAF